MKRPFTLLFIAALLFTASACSEKKPPEPAAIKSKNVLSTLRDMRSAYEKKDLSSFMDNVAPGYQDRDALSRSLAAVFLKNETIHFNIQYTKMVIMLEEKGAIKTTFNWDGEWLAVGGTTQKNSGRVTLLFDPGSFKVMSISGKNPFVPQPSETPGKQ
jgi:hypothetical protein